MRSKVIPVILPVAIGVAGLLSALLVAHSLRNGNIPLLTILENQMINFTFTMQMIVLVNSFLALILFYLYDKKQFRTFFRLNISFRNSQDQWTVYGPAIALLFTIGTTILMSGGVVSQQGAFNKSFLSLLPLVILISATNAWSEEVFSRFIIVAGLYGKLNPHTICWISAVVFGLAHVEGTPGGLFGMIMSGFMGWLLARSVIDTKGIGWALLIHFLQDLVIFGAGAMIIAGNSD